MSHRDNRAYLEDAVGAIDSVAAFLAGFDLPGFLADARTKAAVLHELTVVGEALNRVSDDLRLRHPEVPWSQAIGQRHRRVHGYFDIDYGLIWETATRDLPALRLQLSGILSRLSAPPPGDPPPEDGDPPAP